MLYHAAASIRFTANLEKNLKRMSLYSLTEWLENTAWSVALRESILVYPIVETTHVLVITLFFGLIAFWDMRLIGMTLKRVPVSEIGGKLLPWAVFGFVVSAISGTLLVYSGPVRITHNIFFRVKVLMLFLAGVNVWMFHTGIYRRIAEWDVDAVAPKHARWAGFASLLLWSGIVVSGGLIAYNWFDCDSPSQIALISFLSGCRVE